MKSSRLYLLQPLYNWIIESDMTPNIAIDTEHVGVVVPEEIIDGREIILNIAPTAIRDLNINNENYTLTFRAQFSGKTHHIHLPIGCILSIYAEETGRGLLFSDYLPEPLQEVGSPQQPWPAWFYTPNEEEPQKERPIARGQPFLQIVADNEDE